MSFFSSLAISTGKRIHDGVIKTLAEWDPETVGEAQLVEWNSKAAELATISVKAAEDRDNLRKKIDGVVNDIDRYSSAAEKLAATNDQAANKAADKALELQTELETLKVDLADAELWANETRESAIAAQEKVAKGRQAIEAAKREQARATQAAQVAQQRLKDRERVAGISSGLDGADLAINALKENAAEAKRKAEAAKLRAGVLNKGAEADAAINAALAEVDGNPKTETIQEKLARLKKVS